MQYAQSRHLVTIHLAADDATPLGPVLCGARPRSSCWYGQDEWRFSAQMPTLTGAWSHESPESVLCKRCTKAARRLPA